MGRILTDRRFIGSAAAKATTYTYNLDGSLAKVTPPGGRVVTFCENAPDPRGPGAYPGLMPGGETPDIPIPVIPPFMPEPVLAPI
jgi:hypothetical protein